MRTFPVAPHLTYDFFVNANNLIGFVKLSPTVKPLEKFAIDLNPIESVEASYDLARHFNVGFLILSDRNYKFSFWSAVNHYICRLQNRVSQESECMQVLVLYVVERFFIGRDAFEPAERRHHRKQQLKLGVFRDRRLEEKRALRGIEA